MKNYRKRITKGILGTLVILTLSGCAANYNEQELLQGVGASKDVEILTAEEEAARAEEEAKAAEEKREKENDSEKEELSIFEEKAKLKEACEEASAALKKIAEKHDSAGDFAVFSYNLKTNIFGSYNNHKMQAASLIKVFIAGAVYENWESLIDQGSEEGELESLLKSMITVSDNHAANTLISKLGHGDDSDGMKVVNAYCKDHGYKNTHLGRLLLASNDQDDNYTSVRDCAKFLRECYHKKLEGAEAILNLMKEQERTGKIPAGVPDYIDTANKTGELSDVENDIAIVWGDEPYILCVMTENISGSGNAIDGIIDISSEVYDLWESEL
ncbi:MAG: class A beta-lactamase-related serine hydrolase [Dorea sp.]|nr:class A beta-lactamase-related serine hydrolase [Dorea sp.]